MPYTYNDGVDTTIPNGATANASDIDTFIQDVKKAYNERLGSLFGGTWESDDPIVITKVGTKITISGGQVYTGIYDAGNSGSAKTIDWDDGDQQKVTLTADCTFTFSNVKVGGSYVLHLLQDGTGGWDITLPAACKQGTAAFVTSFLSQTTGTLTTIAFTVYNSATLITNALTSGSSVS